MSMTRSVLIIGPTVEQNSLFLL